jgi:hypothetical protein
MCFGSLSAAGESQNSHFTCRSAGFYGLLSHVPGCPQMDVFALTAGTPNR